MTNDLLLPAAAIFSILCIGIGGLSVLVRRDPDHGDRFQRDFADSLRRRSVRRREAFVVFTTLRLAISDLDTREFIAQSELDAWRLRSPAAFGIAKVSPTILFSLGPRYVYWARRWMRLINRHDAYRHEANQRFKRRRLREDDGFFAIVEKNPLTGRQRQAIVTDEDTTLVVAGAGTGKTSVIVGKIAYLMRHGLADPDDILVLSFTNAVKEELLRRLKGDNDRSPVEVRTFHSYGLRVIADAKGKRPSMTSMVPNEFAIKKFLRDHLALALQDEATHSAIRALFSRLMYIPPDTEETRTSRHRLLTLAGIEVDSLQEVAIANWLTLNGIAWTHNEAYEHPTATREHRQYQPDFHLTDFGIYLEHFGSIGMVVPVVARSRMRTTAREWPGSGRSIADMARR